MKVLKVVEFGLPIQKKAFAIVRHARRIPAAVLHSERLSFSQRDPSRLLTHCGHGRSWLSVAIVRGYD
jgi:hypothetical protein